MNVRDRIGYDAGGTRLEDALAWAAAHGFHYVDFNVDRTANHLQFWSDERVRVVGTRLPRALHRWWVACILGIN